jgi:hypothetical protein
MPVVQPRPPELLQSAPQSSSHSPTQIESHDVLQQNGSMPQTHDSHEHPAQPVTLLVPQPAPPHAPQSPAHVSHVSVPLQDPSPHTGPQAAHWLVASSLHRVSHATLQQ